MRAGECGTCCFVRQSFGLFCRLAQGQYLWAWFLLLLSCMEYKLHFTSCGESVLDIAIDASGQLTRCCITAFLHIISLNPQKLLGVNNMEPSVHTSWQLHLLSLDAVEPGAFFTDFTLADKASICANSLLFTLRTSPAQVLYCFYIGGHHLCSAYPGHATRLAVHVYVYCTYST